MRKVWILEKFVSAEEMAKSYEDMRVMIEMAKEGDKFSKEEIESLDGGLANYKKVIDENPNGRWCGFEGKIVYRQFCDVAKQLFAEIRKESSELLRQRLETMISIGLIIR